MTTQHRAAIEAIERQLEEHLTLLLAELDPVDGSPADTAIHTVKSFVEVAVRLMKRSSPAQVAEAARFVEIRARLAGVPVIREGA